MRKTFIRITSWWQNLNPQQKLGLRVMVLGALLAVYAILGLLNIVPNPLDSFHEPLQ